MPVLRLTLLLLLALTVWVSCTSLPTIRPGLARLSQPQLEGARGVLSAAQSKAILDNLRSRGEETNIFDRHLALEEAIVGSPLTTGNQVTLLQDGPATYRAMFAAIEGARDHINLETYILDDDDIGQQFMQALLAKRKQGIAVNIIRDSVGTIGTPAAFFAKLTDSGMQVLEFNPVNPLLARAGWSLNQRDHRKLLVVDGHIAFLGGINISSVYSGGSGRGTARKLQQAKVVAWRDTDLQLQGPVVAELQKLFLATWAKQNGPSLADSLFFPPPVTAGHQVVRAIGSSPSDPFSLIYATLLSAIGNAETSVNLTNAYFAPDPQLLAALAAAVARGVVVKLILPSQTDSWLIFHAGRSYYEQLLQSGVKIYERQGVILHSKTALIDGVWATIGSTNLDWRSFLHNEELNAVILGADFGLQVQTMFDRDLAASNEITLGKWQGRPLHFQIKEGLSRIWEYWL